MNFLFVDRILALNPGKETIGIKQVTHEDSFFGVSAYSKNKLILLPSIIGEALGQLCSWNVLKTSHFQFRPVGGVVREIEMFDGAKVGDNILLESHIEDLDVDNLVVNFSGRASVQGKTILTVKNSLAPLLPLHEFNDPEKVKTDFARLYQPEPNFQAVLSQHNNDKMSMPLNAYHFNYDILSIQENKELVAQKKILSSASYLKDHFPRKPVFPLSLLIEYNLLLAMLLIKNENWGIAAVRKIKIGSFVLPEDEVITRITIKEQEGNRCLLNFHNEVNNKKVCIAEAEFGLR